MRDLTAKQMAAAELMVIHPELSQQEVSERIGISDVTLWRWGKREDFKEYMHKLCMERFRDLERLAIKKLKENVAKNNQKAIEYALDYVGYKSADKVEMTDRVIKIEVE